MYVLNVQVEPPTFVSVIIHHFIDSLVTKSGTSTAEKTIVIAEIIRLLFHSMKKSRE